MIWDSFNPPVPPVRHCPANPVLERSAPLSQAARLEQGFLAAVPKLIVALLARHTVVDALEDDGVAADLRPQLGDVSEPQKALGLDERALEAECQHDGIVAAG